MIRTYHNYCYDFPQQDKASLKVDTVFIIITINSLYEVNYWISLPDEASRILTTSMRSK